MESVVIMSLCACAVFFIAFRFEAVSGGFFRGNAALPRTASLQSISSGRPWAHLVRQRAAGAAEAGAKGTVLATEICGDTEVAVGEVTPG